MKLGKITGEVEPFPGACEEDVLQHWNDTCAVKSQQIILKSFGIDIPEDLLAQEATAKGYYTPGEGSSPEDVGKLLNDHGIPTHTEFGGNVYDLVSELAQGHKVIVGVDSDELWRPSFFNDLFGEAANHALIVTGIDTTDPNDVKVIITDPGSGDVAKEYPLDQFIDAWQDANCQYVATDIAPLPQFDNGMINFDFNTGFLPMVGEIPFDIFNNTICPEIDYFMSQVNFPMDISSSTDVEMANNVYAHIHEMIENWSPTEDFHDMLFDNWDFSC